MNDDLVKRLTIRLQEIYDRPHDFSNGQKSEAAGLARDRIEELSNCVAVLEAKLSESEALLAKAVDVLGYYALNDDGGSIARTTLAEVTGGNDRQPTSANDIGNITLDTDEIGIWLINETPEGPQQMGLVTWHEITKRIQQQLLQEKFMLVLAELDKEIFDAE